MNARRGQARLKLQQPDLVDDDDEVGVVMKREHAKRPKTQHSSRATITSIMENKNLRTLFLHTRAMLAIYLLAVEPFPDNTLLTEVITELTTDCWNGNPHLRGISFSEIELKTVSQRYAASSLWHFATYPVNLAETYGGFTGGSGPHLTRHTRSNRTVHLGVCG